MRVTAAQYRKNMEEYNQWEEEERARQDKVIALARMQMRDQRKGFRVPKWIRKVIIFLFVVAVIVACVVLSLAL